MKINSGKAKISGAVFLLCAATISIVRFSHSIGFGGGYTSPYTNQQLAEMTEKTGEMTQQESLRRDKLEFSVQKTGKISDADLDWVIHMLQTSGMGTPVFTRTRHLNMMLVLKHLRTPAPDQEEKIYATTASFLTSNNVQEEIGALATMRAIKDKRAIPSVTMLLRSHNSFVRKQARHTLDVLES